MKRILTLALLFPLALHTMEKSKDEYFGIVAHTMSEATEGETSWIFPLEKDLTSYRYNEQTKKFVCIGRSQQKYIKPDSTPTISTLPKEFAALHLLITMTDVTQSDQTVSAEVCYTIEEYSNSEHRYRECDTKKITLPMGKAKLIYHQNLATTEILDTNASFWAINTQKHYAPGAAGKSKDHFKAGNIFEEIELEDASARLRMPGSHPVSIVMAFLKLEKQNDTYIPVPTENCIIMTTSLKGHETNF